MQKILNYQASQTSYTNAKDNYGTTLDGNLFTLHCPPDGQWEHGDWMALGVSIHWTGLLAWTTVPTFFGFFVF